MRLRSLIIGISHSIVLMLVAGVLGASLAIAQDSPIELRAAQWISQSLRLAQSGDNLDAVTPIDLLRHFQTVEAPTRSTDLLSRSVSRILDSDKSPTILREVRQDTHDGISAFLDEQRSRGFDTRPYRGVVEDVRQSLSDVYIPDTDESAAGTASSLRMPRQIRTLYVFMQTPGPAESAYSERVSVDTRDEFIERLESYRAQARARGMVLIVTATDARHQGWYQPQIEYNGQNLQIVSYRSPDEERIFLGAEIPIW